MFAVSFWGYDMGKRIVQPNRNPNTHTNHTEKGNKRKCIRSLLSLKNQNRCLSSFPFPPPIRYHNLLSSSTHRSHPYQPVHVPYSSRTTRSSFDGTLFIVVSSNPGRKGGAEEGLDSGMNDDIMERL